MLQRCEKAFDTAARKILKGNMLLWKPTFSYQAAGLVGRMGMVSLFSISVVQEQFDLQHVQRSVIWREMQRHSQIE